MMMIQCTIAININYHLQHTIEHETALTDHIDIGILPCESLYVLSR